MKCLFESQEGAQWLSGRVLDSRPKGRGFETQRRHCVLSLSKNINPSLVQVQPKKTRSFITERLLMGRKESNQANKQTIIQIPGLFKRQRLKNVFLTLNVLRNRWFTNSLKTDKKTFAAEY